MTCHPHVIYTRKSAKKYEKIWLIDLIVKLLNQISYNYDLLMSYEGISRENASASIGKYDNWLKSSKQAF